MGVKELSRYFKNNRDSIIAGHKNEYALVAKTGSKHQVAFFADMDEAIQTGNLKYGYGHFAVCHCVPYEESLLQIVNA